jgi:tetratricopeptide (TPR) repeat protein
MTPKLFLSYRRSQLARIQPIVEILRSAGIDPFFDIESIDPLADFPERIRRGIAASHALLAWWSADYALSEHCMAEFKLGWQHARRQGSEVGRRIWVVNPEPRGEHIHAGEVDSNNFLQPPPPGGEKEWADALKQRLETLLPEGPLSDERQPAALPKLVNVPIPSVEFTGRSAEMLRIHSSLHPPQISASGYAAAVQTHGLGGIGKTELAAKYAHDFAHSYPGGIIWLNLSTYEAGGAADEVCAEIAWLKAVEQTFSQDRELLYDHENKLRPATEIRRRLAERFAGVGSYLWILDNVPVLQPEDKRDAILAFWRAPSQNGCTLLTTRDSRPAAGFAAQRLELLSEADALRLLARYRVPATSEIAISAELVHEVGAHTLALTLLGEHLREAPGGYSRLLERVRATGLLSHIEKIAADLREDLGNKARGIIATFNIGLDALNNQARRLLALASLCAPNEPIPVELLANAFGTEAEDECNSALRALLRSSLLTRRREANMPGAPVQIHSLVANAVPLLLNSDCRDLQRQLGRSIVARVPKPSDIRTHAVITHDIAHAWHLAQQLADGSAVNLALCVGSYYFARGSYQHARVANQYATDTARRVLGEEHPDYLIATNDLALTMTHLGEYPAAKRLQENVLPIMRRVMGEQNLETLNVLSNYAGTLQAQGNLQGAREIQEQALQTARKAVGDEHDVTLRLTNDLAVTLWYQGDLDPARKLLEKLLTWHRDNPEHNPRERLFVMDNLAKVLCNQGDSASAQILQEEVLTSSRRIFGDEHPDTLRAMQNLAMMLDGPNNLARRRGLLESVLPLSRRINGEDHINTIIAMESLALLLKDLGDLSRARTLLENALTTSRRALGAEHPETLDAMSNLAVTLEGQGDLTGAKSLQAQVLPIMRRVKGEEHPDTLLAAWNLLWTCYRQSDRAACKDILSTTGLWRLLMSDSATLSSQLQYVKGQLMAIRSSLED